MIDLTNYKVHRIVSPGYEYWLPEAVRIIDEGSFYRIAGTHIIDKHKIRSIELAEDNLTMTLTDQVVILKVVT